MAGVKGRSGGARPGAGRPKKEPQEHDESGVFGPDTNGMQPLDVLQTMMNDPEIPVALRIKAAQAAAQYVHPKIGDGGKKAETADRAKVAASKFKPATPPPPTRLQ